jgi:hypothetical protein
LLEVHLEYDARLLCAPGLLRLKPAGAVVGFGGVGYNPSGPVPAYLQYLLLPAHRGRGPATVPPANTAAVRVLESCGLTRQRSLPEQDRLLYRAARPAARGRPGERSGVAPIARHCTPTLSRRSENAPARRASSSRSGGGGAGLRRAAEAAPPPSS